jgi:putative nucleotidyltransferase with HDIG domain
MAGVTPAVPAISEPKSVRAEAKVTLANRIMVVDDEPEILRFLERALSAKGYGVEVYSSAEACLQALRTPGRQYDVILTDVRMPNKSGLELLEELHEEDDSIIKIVMTGTATVDTAIASLRHGAYDFVEKPVPLKQLLAILERATEYRRIMLENREYRNNLEAMVEEQSTELRHTLEKVKRSYDFTLEAMAGLLDAREQDSGQHSKRVRDLALVLGSHMGLPTDELQVVAQGALLHDIGKIGVPDSVLRKADALDEDEWELMRGHPALGYRVLRSADWLRNVAEIVYAHHERYDGDGYPRGIAGDEICLGARIFAVIDSYDAMRSDRVYRKALSAEHARSEVLNGSGTQFDPGVVEAFRACADEIERVFREMSDGASR